MKETRLSKAADLYRRILRQGRGEGTRVSEITRNRTRSAKNGATKEIRPPGAAPRSVWRLVRTSYGRTRRAISDELRPQFPASQCRARRGKKVPESAAEAA